MKSNQKNIVVKSNKIVEARYKLSVQEQRIILALTSMIKPDDRDFHTYRFTVKQLMNLTGVKGENYYSQIKEVTKGLIEKSLTIKEPTGDLQISWLSSAKYWDNEGVIDLCFSPKLKPYLLQLKSHFTQYQLENVAKLRSNYSIRIYELLKQYENTSRQKRVFNLDELRVILGIEEGRHKRFNDFKRYVIEVAKKELPKKTDIGFDYRLIKTSRKITAIKFILKPKKKSKTNTQAAIEAGLTLKYKDQTHTLDETLCFPYDGGCIPAGDIAKLLASGEMTVIL